METKTPDSPAVPANISVGSANGRRRHRNGSDPNLRYFLPKSRSSPAKPELGQEMASEGEALIEAFKNGQPFYTLTAWKAVPEVNGGGSPVIVKQAVVQKPAQS
ncbi:MAG: hypothetical protein WBQ03_21480 [Candidatus Sulfotelmatobacter sp.]